MKKTLVMTIVLALILSVVTVVNAASTTKDVTATVTAPAKAEAGKTIEVKVDLGDKFNMGKFTVKYDNKVLEYAGIEEGTVQNRKAVEGGMYLQWTSVAEPYQTLTVKFNVLADAKDGEYTVAFAPDNGSIRYRNSEGNTTIANFAAADYTSGKIVIGEQTPVTPEKPDDGKDPVTPGDDTNKPGDDTQKPGDDTQKPGDDTQKPSDDTQKPADDTNKGGETNTNEKTPTKDLQTGVNTVAVVAPVVALIAIAALVAKKIQK